MARQVFIRWSDEIEFSQIEQSKQANHYGLYMILEAGFKRSRKKWYRGKDRELIYLGIVKSNARDFRKRMQEHRADWLSRIAKNQIFVKFGILETYGTLDDQLIEDAESALVFEHQPSENTSKKQSYTISQDLIVKNINHGGYVEPTIHTKKHTG